MASKSTKKRQISSDKVIAAGTNHLDEVCIAVAGMYDPPTAESIRQVVCQLIAHLREITQKMVAADDAHENELRDDPEKRELKALCVERVRDNLVFLRRTLDTMYGEAYVAKLGFSGPTPSDPVSLLRLSQSVLSNLPTTTRPNPAVEGFEFKLEYWQEKLDTPHQQLQQAKADVDDEERQAESTLVAKNEAIADYDRSFTLTANLLSAIFEAAGKTELARRIRPSRRRKGQTREDAAVTAASPTSNTP